jgi:UDP-N-acetylmuramate--alanine ligase
MLKLGQNIHFIGIGGIGMSALAKILLLQGYRISGSDNNSNRLTDTLSQMGAAIYVGQKAENIDSTCSVVIISSAIKSNNPELMKAKELGLPIIKRGEVLAFLFNDHPEVTSVAIAGTHGKTTTTSLLSFVMNDIGLSPTSIVGGEVNDFGSNAIVGSGKYIVTEADESDGSFLHLTPSIAVITNIEADHLDHYTNGLDEIIEAFEKYVSNSKTIVICGDDTNNQMLLLNLWLNDNLKPFISYGFEDHNRIQAKNTTLSNGKCQYDLYIDDKFIKTVTLSIGGRHNILNSMAVIGVLYSISPDRAFLENAICSLNRFSGVKRRFEKLAATQKLVIYDDYAHHPSEIKAVMNIAQSFNKPVIAVFQPHRYSRLAGLFDEFVTSFNNAQTVIITDTYSAGESPIDGVNAKNLAREIKAYMPEKEVLFIQDKTKIAGYVTKKYDKGEDKIVILMGAGNLNSIAKDFPVLASKPKAARVKTTGNIKLPVSARIKTEAV